VRTETQTEKKARLIFEEKPKTERDKKKERMSAANENTLTIKVRSQDPVGEYEFSVCKTVSAFYVFSFGFVPSLFLSLSSFIIRLAFPERARPVVTLRREISISSSITRAGALRSRPVSAKKTQFLRRSAVLFFRSQSPLSRAEIDPISLFPSSSFWTFFFFVFFSASSQKPQKKIDFLTLTLFSSSHKRTDENPRFEETGGDEIRGETVRTAHFVPRTVGRGRYELIVGAGGE